MTNFTNTLKLLLTFLAFLVIFTSLSAQLFETRVQIGEGGSGSNSYTVNSAKLNNDNTDDVILRRPSSFSVDKLVLGLTNSENYIVDWQDNLSDVDMTWSLEIHDLNNDGFGEIQTNLYSGFYSRTPESIEYSYHPYLDVSGYGYLGTGHFNNDQYLDIVMANFSEDQIVILLNDTEGGFETQPTVILEDYDYTNISPLADYVVVADLTGNDLSDIVIFPSETGDSTKLLSQSSAGEFELSHLPLTRMQSNITWDRISLVDYDLDGDLDIMHKEPDNWLIVRNFEGQFPEVELLTEVPNRSVRFYDLNSDDLMDLIYYNSEEDGIVYQLQENTGQFADAVPLTNNRVHGNYAILDFDGDGDWDIVTQEFSSNFRWHQYVYINTTDPVSTVELLVPNAIRVFPNPSKGDFNLHWEASEVNPHWASLYNPVGQLVWRKQINSGSQTFEIPARMPNGIYKVIVSDKDGRWLDATTLLKQ